MPRKERMDDAEVRKFLRKMQSALPTIYPLRFERAELSSGDWGDCSRVTRRGRRYLLIRIADWLPWPADFMVLLHELGHARTWKHDKLEVHEKEDHGPEWGIKHAEVWRKSR